MRRACCRAPVEPTIRGIFGRQLGLISAGRIGSRFHPAYVPQVGLERSGVSFSRRKALGAESPMGSPLFPLTGDVMLKLGLLATLFIVALVI
jgi:hypothetical protein